jgi:ADP-heptose:LPS heptosyltransferase
METLILKLGAAGDVVRTSTLLRRLPGAVSWGTAEKNIALLSGARKDLRCVAWDLRAQLADRKYDLVINLEDTLEAAGFVQTLQCDRIFGAHVAGNETLQYSDDSRGWFDLSLISRFGRAEADRLKLLNRRTYQDLIFDGLKLKFAGETYVLPEPARTGLTGDVAISRAAGPVWPMKNWAYYDALKLELEKSGLTVNELPERPTLIEHLGDVAGHRCLVSGDSLPMHLALGSGTRCVTLFTCTSPWEIHDYGLQHKIISPLLAQFFYQRGRDERAMTAISVAEVVDAVRRQLSGTSAE